MRFFLTHSLIFALFLLIFGYFFRNGNLVHGDFATAFLYKNQSYLNIFFYGWLDNFFLGYPSLIYTFPRLPFYLLMDSINAIFGYNYWWLYFPILFFVRYYLFYRLLLFFKCNIKYSILIALIYALNFYFLDRTAHIYLIFASTAIPLLLLTYLSIIKNFTLINFLGFHLSLFIILSNIHIVVLCLYFMILLFIYKLYEFYIRRKLKIFLTKNLILSITIILIFSYLFLPLYSYIKPVDSNHFQGLSMNILYDSIFHYSHLSTLPNTIIGVGFLGSEVYEYKYILYFSLFFTLLYLLIILIVNKKSKYFYLFFFQLLLFIFLSSYNLFAPHIITLKKYLPGFDLFTDSSMIIIFIVFLLYLLLGIAINLNKFKYIKYLLGIHLLFSFIILFLYLAKFDTYKIVNIPKAYESISEYLVDAQRIYVYPPEWVQQFGWSEGLIMSGFYNMYFADKNIVGSYILEGTLPTTIKILKDYNRCVEKKCEDFLKLSKHLGVDYIIAFKGFNKKVNANRANFESYVRDGSIFLIKEDSQYDIFKIADNPLPLIHSRDITYYKLNPTAYIVEFNKFAGKQNLHLLNSFDTNWKVREMPDVDVNCLSTTYFAHYRTIECDEYELNYVMGIWQMLINNNKNLKTEHSMVYGYANKWSIQGVNSSELRKDKKHRVFVYFQPQLYFFIGVFISLITIIISFCYFFYKKKTL